LLFQGVGVILGGITRLTRKRNLFRADTFVENRAIKDYSGFVKSVPYDEDTVKFLPDIIADEEIHIKNWKAAADSFKNK